MSLTQSTRETNDPLFRNQGGGRSSYGYRGRGRGRGRSYVGPNSQIDSLSSQNLCYKKVNNAHGGQLRPNHESVNTSDSNPASGTHSVKNDPLQPALQGVSTTPAAATVAKPADAPPYKNGQPLPKAPSSSANSDSPLPSTPANGDGAKAFFLQFGSLSPVLTNDWQAPAHTSSAPLNLDEQRHDQAPRDALKQDLSKKAVVTQETKTEPQAKKDLLLASTKTQAQNICGLNPQIHSQGSPTSSLQMSPHMPLEMGNSSQIPQQVFVPGLICPSSENHPLLAYTTYHSVGYYSNSYMTGPPVLPAPSSLPLTSTKLNGTTQGSRFHHLGVNLPSTNQSARVPAYVSAATTIPATLRSVVNATPKEVPSVPSHVDAISKVTDVTSISIGDAQNGQKQPSKKVDGQYICKGFKDLDDSSETATSKSSQSIMILTSSGLGEVAPSDSSAIKVFANSSHASESCESQANVAAKQNCSPPCEDITRESSVRKDEVELEGPEVLSPDNALKGSDALNEADQGNKVKLAKKAAVISKPISAITLEAPTEHESKIMDILRPSSLSGSISGSNKVAMEPNKTKNRGKKLKELLQKADALGATTDLYMAYKGSEDNEERFVASEHAVEGNMNEVSANANGIEKNTLKNKDEEGKVEIDDWEEVVDISTPNLDFFGEAVHSEGGVTAKKYSRDFLLTFSDQCTYIPEGFEITSDVAGALMCGSVSTPRSGREYLSPRRAVDRQGGVSQPDRRGSRTTDADKWRKQPGPFPPSQDSRRDIGYRSIVLGSQGGRDPTYGNIKNPPAQHAEWVLPGQRNQSDSWQRGSQFNKVLMPSTHAQAPVIHKAEIKYEVGKVTDEEQAKQRKLKGILNKLTPQNFERLFEQIKEVNIDNVTTLTGVISQIFDKALTEPTFCEMYANFCQHLASELPDLTVDNEKITFRRLLLNKCQEEFERGEREEQEACNVDVGVEGNTEQSEEGREEKRVKARRRMLGNIRLIGELYKKRMLTERIMHECIKKLLGQSQNPDEENIEALCKLMSTIGEMIDHLKAKEHMDAYFDIMRQLSDNMVLSSRVRFMLKDAIDLRKNKWQQRMKVEGPKMIEDVHREAAQERQGLVSRSNHGSSFNSMRRGQPSEFGPQGSMLSPSVGQGMSFRGIPSQVRGFGGQDMLTVARSISMPLPQRLSADKQITLGPQGGLARGMASRGQLSVSNPPILDNPPSLGNHRRLAGGFNGYGTALERGVYSTREDHFNRNSRNRVGASAYDQLSGQELHPSHTNRDLRFLNQNLKSSRPTTPPLPSAGVSFIQNSSTERPEERLRDMARAAIKEYYSAKDEKEVALCIKDMNSPSFCSTVVSLWVSDSFERKDFERESLAELLVALTKPCDGTFSRNQLIKGFELVLTDLEDTLTDAPKAPEFLGQIFAKVVLENVLSLEDVGWLIQHGGEEAGRLVEVGLAAEVLGSLLETIKSVKGESSFKEIRGCCNLQLEAFRPPHPISCRKLDMFI